MSRTYENQENRLAQWLRRHEKIVTAAVLLGLFIALVAFVHHDFSQRRHMANHLLVTTGEGAERH